MPFGPHRCGLYEAARDHARADLLRGHDVLVCDTGCGVDKDGKKVQGEAEQGGGKIDDRGGWALTTSAWAEAHQADLWVCHDGVPAWMAERSMVPEVWMLHGRPQACFRPEQWSEGSSWSLFAELGSDRWPRARAMVTYWQEHVPFWSPILGSKLRTTIDPPLDLNRFQPKGQAWEWVNPGDFNVLICDSWRKDVDIFEAVIGVAAAQDRVEGLRLHIWGWDQAWERPWQKLIPRLRERGLIGEIRGRMVEIDQAYRAADLVVSPHGISVRTIMEAMACGTPVVAATGHRHAQHQAAFHNPVAVASAVERVSQSRVEASADAFALDLFGERIEDIYEEALDRQGVTV